MSLEPLADSLKPQFGNIYDYNLGNYDGPGIEVQEWTDELREAVKHYLLTEVDDDLFASLLDWLALEVPAGDRGRQIDVIIERSEAWEIAHAFHLIAVVAVPTLDELIGQAPSWSDGSMQVDAAEWLDAHASPEQLSELAEHCGRPERIFLLSPYDQEPIGEDFTRTLTPPDLLAAWRRVEGSAETDLSDQEWELLVPALREVRAGRGTYLQNAGELLSLRRAFSGNRYKFSRDVPWSHIPPRYGTWHNVYQRYMNYRDGGDFARMLEVLRGQAGAERVVKWLETVATRPPRES
jgi:transposase